MRVLVLSALLAVALVAPPAAHVTHAASPVLPQTRLEFGLGNDPGNLGWMTGSGVPWRYRYVYLAGGVNTSNPWQNWNSPTGAYATNYMSASAANGYIPVFTYYELLQSNPSVGANESDRDFSNLNNATTMAAYYGNFKLLMQLVGAFGQTVVVHVEPDLWGYLEQRAAGAGASSLSASVASSGISEAAGIPNTAQGFAWTLLKLRDTYAPNALLAIHASAWGSGIDIASDTNPAVDATAEADTTAAFLDSAGISSNPYGGTWDLVFNDVDDHDAGWWEQQGADNQYFTHWWDPTNTAYPNFNRYLTWVGELRTKTSRPQVVWQVPVGNQYFLTMNNTCGHYQDNIAPYFISHASSLFAAGLIAVLFGAGNACQTTYTDGRGDGVTNNSGVPTTDAAGSCNACNTHASSYSDDDGGYLRIFIGQYYAAADCAATPLFTSYFNWYDKATYGMVGDNIHLLNTGTGASAGCVSVGALSIPFDVPAGAERYVTFPAGTIGGPVVVKVLSGPAIQASQRVQYFESFNEVWAMTAAQASTTSYVNWYDRATPGMSGDNIHILNPQSGTANVTLTVGTQTLSFAVPAGAEHVATFPIGTIGGPVVVNASAPVLASQRVQYYQSFNESLARSAGDASQTSYFNWFDNATYGMVGDNIHVLNPGAGVATVTLTVAGSRSTFGVPAGAEHVATFPSGTIGGPVTVSSSAPVLASQRVQYFQSFNEVASESSAQALTTSHVMWFDMATAGMVGDNIHVLNTGGSAAGVTVSAPGGLTQHLSLVPGAEGYVTFGAGVIGGPVTIASSVPVIAAQRVQYFTSFNEVPAR